MSLFFSFLRKFFLLVLITSTTCIIWITADAAIIDEIAEDFKPLSGYVVMSSEEEYIIDLDDTNGVVIGDLFSVVTAGKKIVHPVTQKVLGTLEEVKGILKVIRIKSGYSFARVLGKSTNIKRGDPIRRYENMPALFWDYTGKGKSFFAQLQLTLPALKWQDYKTAQRSRPPQLAPPAKNYDTLIFILHDRGVEVRDPEFYVIRTYNPPESLSQISPRPTASEQKESHAKLAPAPLVAKPTPTEVSKAETYSKVTKEAARFKPEFERAQTIGKISSSSVMTDFIKYKNQLLMASTNGTAIEIYNVTDKLILLAQGAPSYPGQILSLKWWYPSEKGPLYLTLISWADKSVNGNIFTLNGKNLTPFIERIPRILGTFDLDGDKRPETLLSQGFDGENFFGGNVRELKLIKGKIKSFKPAIQLPRRFTVIGSLFADLTGDGQLETAFIRKGILYIYNEKNLLHRSPKHMGGSLSFLTYDVDSTAKNIMPTSASFEVSPVAADLDGDGLPEILAVASERDIIGDVAAAPGIKKSWLEVLKFSDGRFVKGTLGEGWDTPLQGLVVDDQRVLLVATEPGDIFGKGRNSHLLAYSLEL
jgi:hypothetical protein